jgi:hypothetical protein
MKIALKVKMKKGKALAVYEGRRRWKTVSQLSFHFHFGL